MINRLLVGVILVLTTFTATMMALVARNQLASRPVAVEPLRSQMLPPEQWQRLLDQARVIAGPPGGTRGRSISLLEFSDFECPACRQFSRTIAASSARYAGRVTWLYRDYPLEPIHPQAMTAAKAGICADSAGAFPAFYKVVFDSQDSLPQVHWAKLAQRAGVQDTVRFLSCLTGGASVRLVERDMMLGDSVGVLGTPTVIVNGVRLSRPPTGAELDSILHAIQ